MTSLLPWIRSLWSQRLALAGGAVALIVSASGANAQATGVVRGTVTESATGSGLSDVQVFAVGSRRGSVTNRAGRYVITGVPAGRVTVRTQKLGYAPAQTILTLAPSDTATADFKVSVAALALDEVVVTGTPGATEKRVLGNVVSTVKTADILAAAPAPNIAEVLQGRTAGVNVMSQSGAVGTGNNIRIRGSSSLSASYNPVVYIDGIRMNAGAQQSFDNTGAGAQATSAMDAVDPNDIESIEVIKGPAAATLYGADAASGVIQIITKKGKMGQQSVQWSAKAEEGNIEWALARPKRYWYCTDAEIVNPTLYPACAALGANPSADQRMLINDPLNEPGALREGSTTTFGLSARGGGDRYSFYLSADHDAEDGVLYTNYFKRNNGRANFQVNLLDNLDVAVNAGYARTDAQTPLSDNSSNSVLRNAYRDRPSGPWPWQFAYRGLGPNIINQYQNQVQTERYILGSTLTYQPRSWFHNRLTLGADINNQTARNFYGIDTTGRQPWGATVANGYIAYLLPTTHIWTFDYAGTANATLPKALTSASSVGVQYTANTFDEWTTIGQGLVANSLNLVGAAATRDATQRKIDQKSFGTYVQEQVGWRDRLFVTGAVRVDNNSAFGRNFKLVTYPKASVSYVISDEPFFHLPQVDQFKLRAAWGEAGNAPAPFTADRAYEATQTAVGETTVNALQTSTYGNPNLRAETGSEIEVGFDASTLQRRLGIEFTYYNKKTQHALVSLPAPASTGFLGTYLANIGEISNVGLELSLNATPIQRPNLSWEANMALTTNHNKLVTFGTNAFNNVIFGTFANTQEFAPGYPLGAYFATDVKRDASGAPLLDANGKVQLDPAMNYLGPSTPTREVSLSNSFTLFKNIRLYGYADYKGGYYMWDAIKYVNDRIDLNTWAVNDPNADPIHVQVLQSGATKPDIVRADYIKLRELSAAYTLPQRLTSHFNAKSVTLTLAGRNLQIWKLKGYPGLDPEVEFWNQTSTTSTARFDRTDYLGIPMQRRFSVSMNIAF
jgi:TonB-linked SusC/RagA family outer membrane protein